MSKNVIPFPKSKSETFVARPKTGTALMSLASGLMVKLHINPDTSLVSLLGKGNELSNHEAIITWMLSNYTRDEIDSMEAPLESLAKALHNYLLENMEDASC